MKNTLLEKLRSIILWQMFSCLFTYCLCFHHIVDDWVERKRKLTTFKGGSVQRHMTNLFKYVCANVDTHSCRTSVHFQMMELGHIPHLLDDNKVGWNPDDNLWSEVIYTGIICIYYKRKINIFFKRTLAYIIKTTWILGKHLLKIIYVDHYSKWNTSIAINIHYETGN